MNDDRRTLRQLTTVFGVGGKLCSALDICTMLAQNNDLVIQYVMKGKNFQDRL